MPAVGSLSRARQIMNRCTLVLGGAASGKSAFAENLIFQTDRPRVYVATSQAWDDEMRQKIADHQTQRGPDWRTIEEPVDIAAALSGVAPHEAVLIDCATLWLTNVMLGDYDLGTETDRLMSALAGCPAPVVIVSNETGLGIIPDNKLARDFRNAQGRLNQTLAAQADAVVFVAAGLPLVMKGAIA